MATNSLPPHDPASSLPRWRGYTIEDLRYRRAVNSVKMEVAREQLQSRLYKFSNLQSLSPFKGNSLISKMFSGFSIIDYGVMAYQGVRQITRLYQMFRRR